jgi:hypothetical protein
MSDLTDEISSAPPIIANWVAKDSTYIKASEKLARDLPDHERIGIKPGARLAARMVDDTKSYWIVSDAKVDDTPVPPNIKFLYKPSWTLISTHPVEAGVQPVTPERTSPGSREDRIRIRSYELWELDGRPADRSDHYWHRAASEVTDEADGREPAWGTVSPIFCGSQK